MKKLSKAYDERGASMGRPSNTTESQATVRFHLNRIPLDSGGYDSGGAYWGSGAPLYHAVDDGTNETQEVQEMWTRAANRDSAKEKVRLVFPNATFFR